MTTATTTTTNKHQNKQQTNNTTYIYQDTKEKIMTGSDSLCLLESSFWRQQE